MNARKLSHYYRAIADAEDALTTCPKSVEDFPVETFTKPEDVFAAAITSARNIVLAGSAEKAALLGTLSTAPTATAKGLEADGLTKDAAAELLAKAAELRTAALALKV